MRRLSQARRRKPATSTPAKASGTSAAAHAVPGNADIPEGAALPADIHGSVDSLAPQATALLYGVTKDLTGLSDAEVAEALRTTTGTWVEGGYQSSQVTTPAVNVAIAEELRTLRSKPKGTSPMTPSRR
jgi:hypothetical protein